MNAWEETILDKQEAYEEGHAAGLVNGAMQEKKMIAKNLKDYGMSPEVIAENTGLTLEEIEEL